ncbi:MBL fold metallo-hydrolase [Kitasatospora sp. NBC_01287]|uniref:MBL fold metallo-hydrolase n=1 Tax=Kitasatospora sp. NBC_01287 TaxID=2903573 RepID=UPI0022522912|nr:MBL fold metallo-hydrolase [Kitasatospora sp. NBC_01287]MCX4745685.1 MBL fold metallo-hydrolase [Kitasatospora sp. NBC_01287]
MRPTTDGPIDFVTGAPGAGSLAVDWIHGTASRRGGGPPLQVHQYDEHTVILRQSMAVNYEAPFIFLLFGNDRALLLDTGATADATIFPLRATVDRLVAEWLDRHPGEQGERGGHGEHGGRREPYGLVVAHTHGHGDHVAADGQFADRPATTVVPREAEAVGSFFGFEPDRPLDTVTFDLGGRVLEILPSPGHHRAAITVYDPWSGILFTGDTVLPGRLYVEDHAAFRATVERMVEFAGTHPVTHVLGCHVEMSRRPGGEYPIGATYQPDERVPEMTVAQLVAVRDATVAVAGRPGVHRFDDFVIYNEPRKTDMRKLVARGLAHQLASPVLRLLPGTRRRG